jgi:hypothetical protein
MVAAVQARELGRRDREAGGGRAAERDRVGGAGRRALPAASTPPGRRLITLPALHLAVDHQRIGASRRCSARSTTLRRPTR